MNASLALEQFIKGWEQCCLKPHLDHGQWMVGWEHHMAANEDTIASITQDEADALFAADLRRYAHQIDRIIQEPVTQSQFDSVVSLAQDLGCRACVASLVVKRINGGYVKGAAAQFEACPGNHERRLAERDMFLHARYDHSD